MLSTAAITLATAPEEKKAHSQIKDMDIQNHITCPISGSIFHDPVTLPSSGRVVEREVAMRLSKDPFTRKLFTYSNELTTNFTMKTFANEYLERHPEEKENQYNPQNIQAKDEINSSSTEDSGIICILLKECSVIATLISCIVGGCYVSPCATVSAIVCGGLCGCVHCNSGEDELRPVARL